MAFLAEGHTIKCHDLQLFEALFGEEKWNEIKELYLMNERWNLNSKLLSLEKKRMKSNFTLCCLAVDYGMKLNLFYFKRTWITPYGVLRARFESKLVASGLGQGFCAQKKKIANGLVAPRKKRYLWHQGVAFSPASASWVWGSQELSQYALCFYNNNNY